MSVIISFDGIGGSGKSTQVQRLNTYFSPNSYLVPELNEHPVMQAAIGAWRQKTKDREAPQFDLTDITRLAIARAQSQKDYLSQAKNPSWIFMDRGVYTALVYESGQVSMDEIEQVNRVQGAIFPNLCILLDCDIKEALARIDERRRQVWRYNARAAHETEEILAERRRLYQELAERKRGLIKIVDSNCNEDVLLKKFWRF